MIKNGVEIFTCKHGDEEEKKIKNKNFWRSMGLSERETYAQSLQLLNQ